MTSFLAIKPDIIYELKEGKPIELKLFQEHKFFDDINSAKKWLTSITKISIYTDGSAAEGNRGDKPAGWAYVAQCTDGTIIERKGKLKKGTNNIAELTAIKMALIDYKDEELDLYTDSEYSMKSICIWSKNWIKNGWLTKSGKPVKNKELIDSIINIIEERKVKIKHVKAHDGNKLNERADKLANEARMN